MATASRPCLSTTVPWCPRFKWPRCGIQLCQLDASTGFLHQKRTENTHIKHRTYPVPLSRSLGRSAHNVCTPDLRVVVHSYEGMTCRNSGIYIPATHAHVACSLRMSRFLGFQSYTIDSFQGSTVMYNATAGCNVGAHENSMYMQCN